MHKLHTCWINFLQLKKIMLQKLIHCNGRVRSVAVLPLEVFEVSCYAGKLSAAWRRVADRRDILIDASSSRPFSTFCPATQSGEEVSGGRALVS